MDMCRCARWGVADGRGGFIIARLVSLLVSIKSSMVVV